MPGEQASGQRHTGDNKYLKLCDSSTGTKRQKRTETDRKGQKLKETEQNRQKQTAIDRNGQKWTETAKTDRNGQNRTETDIK